MLCDITATSAGGRSSPMVARAEVVSSSTKGDTTGVEQPCNHDQSNQYHLLMTSRMLALFLSRDGLRRTCGESKTQVDRAFIPSTYTPLESKSRSIMSCVSDAGGTVAPFVARKLVGACGRSSHRWLAVEGHTRNHLEVARTRSKIIVDHLKIS